MIYRAIPLDSSLPFVLGSSSFSSAGEKEEEEEASSSGIAKGDRRAQASKRAARPQPRGGYYKTKDDGRCR